MLTFMLTDMSHRFETPGGGCLILELEDVLIVRMWKFSSGLTVDKLEASKTSEKIKKSSLLSSSS